MQYSLLTPLNFSKAYDAACGEKFLLNTLDAGIAFALIQQLRSFLNDCRARIQLFNVFSSSRRLTQGLPQGSVLAPLLFLFYVDNLTSSLTNDAVTALFADDVSILTTGCKREDAEAVVQSVVNSVLDVNLRFYSLAYIIITDDTLQQNYRQQDIWGFPKL